MTNIDLTSNFNQEKAIETILFLATRAPVPNLFGICKMLYLADKTSLEEYGRFIFGDSHVAMQKGGTPSHAYNLLKRIREQPTNDIKIENNHVIALRQPELDYLSQSDIECLEQTIDKYGKSANWADRNKACHDEAWQKAWNERGRHGSNPIDIESIAQLFEEPDILIDYLSNRNAD